MERAVKRVRATSELQTRKDIAAKMDRLQLNWLCSVPIINHRIVARRRTLDESGNRTYIDGFVCKYLMRKFGTFYPDYRGMVLEIALPPAGYEEVSLHGFDQRLGNHYLERVQFLYLLSAFAHACAED